MFLLTVALCILRYSVSRMYLSPLHLNVGGAHSLLQHGHGLPSLLNHTLNAAQHLREEEERRNRKGEEGRKGGKGRMSRERKEGGKKEGGKEGKRGGRGRGEGGRGGGEGSAKAYFPARHRPP